MKTPRRPSVLGHSAAAIAGLATAAAGTTPAAPWAEPLARQGSAVFTNGGFETGTAGQPPPPPWAVTDYLNPNPNGVTIQTPQTFAGLNLETQGAACGRTADCVNNYRGSVCTAGHCEAVPKTIILSGNNQPDPTLGPLASLRWPRYGAQCALVNQLGALTNVNALTQTMTVGAGDVDPNDGQIHVRLVVAPVLEDPGHLPNQQPYFFVQLVNTTQGNAVLYENYNFSNESGVPWKTVMAGGNTYRYTDWQLIDVAPGSPAINVNDSVTLTIIGAGCSLGGHFGEVYVDGVGEGIQGLYVSGSAPAQANPGTAITYTLTYANGSGSAETGVLLTFHTPPNTTFASYTTPAGGVCAQAGGTVTCTFAGTVAAGATGSMTVTVQINAGITTGTIVEGNYQISSVEETPLLGNKITTTLGCSLDSQCSKGNFCNESGNACTPTLANGTKVFTDPAHTNPTLDGSCTTAAGTLVCTSAVCDTNDNECGYANGDGTCTAGDAGDAATVCRSGACDPDGKCGYAVGDGPCTIATGPTVCRSGVCSVAGTCEAPGTCNVDGDCAAGHWCDESVHACTPREPNGTAVPNDPPHTNPTLNGTCTAAAGTLVCVSGVCDTADSRCGYANGDGTCTAGDAGDAAAVCRSGACDPDGKCGYAVGDGPCTAVNGGTVCRSGMCSADGKCEAAGSCNVDGDCTGGTWCDESVHACTAPLANGLAVPTDTPHTSPTLNGTCTQAAGALVCASAVCDVHENECGFANGDGPCTLANGPIVCRSGLCSQAGTCEPSGGCNADTDCSMGKWCDESAHACQAPLPNGAPIPTDTPHSNPTLNGTCNAPAATLVCASKVCDAKDNKCGYADGDGPCSAADAGGAVCRSGTCNTSGTCGTMAGCTTDADCADPALPVCDPTTHTCHAAVDAAVADAGLDAGAAEAGAVEASDAGYVEGGGCSIGRTPGARAPSLAGILMGGWLVVARRRRVKKAARG